MLNQDPMSHTEFANVVYPAPSKPWYIFDFEQTKTLWLIL